MLLKMFFRVLVLFPSGVTDNAYQIVCSPRIFFNLPPGLTSEAPQMRRMSTHCALDTKGKQKGIRYTLDDFAYRKVTKS